MGTIYGTAGDDQLTGTVGDDVLDAGAGNDTLYGDQGADAYVFGYGYGHDRIFNEEPEHAQAVDRILLNPGVSPDDVVLSTVTLDAQGNPIPESLLLTLRSSGETLLVYGNYASSPTGYLYASIDSIEFADGTVWNWMEIEQRSHQINGTSGDDVLVGGSSDEVIMAGAGNDVLIGGEGRDTLVGESGSDTYVFGYGAGHDVVINSESESEQSVDRIHLAGVSPSDVALSVVTVDHRGMTIPASLLLTLRSTGETLLVREHFESFSGTPTTSAIDFIEFTDGTVWSRSDIQQLAGGGEPVTYITGTPWNDTLWGTSGNDVIDGGSGDDYLWGGEGSDTYVFGHGYGHDRISNTEPYENLAIDRIRLLPGVTPEDVELREVVQDVNGFLLPASLQLRLRSTGETLIVLDSVEGNLGNNAIDFIEFADGTVWDKDEITRRARLVEGTAGDDLLVGGVLADVLDGGAGNDILIGGEGGDTYVFGQGYGHDQIDNWEPDNNQSFDRILLKSDVSVADVEVKRVAVDANGMAIPPSLLLRLRSTGETLLVRNQFFPNTNESANPAIDRLEFADGTIWDRTEIERRANLIEGTAGDDWLTGSQGDDVIDGGPGNDMLAGDLGSDTYLFGQGSGHDVIHNKEPEGMTSSDRILLKPEVISADVELRVVTLDANGWSIPPSLQLRLKSTGETVTVMNHFDPNVWGEAAITTIEFADGTVWDTAEIVRRVHLFEGTTGDDWLIASDGDDVLDGGAGNDQLMGGLGSDTYAFGYGSGHDLILDQEFPGATSSDRILLKPGVTTADVELRITTADANGNSLLPSLQLRLKSTGETMIVMGQFLTDAYGELGITTIEFADGTVWNQAEIERRAHLFEGTPGDDWIMGSMGNDVLDGGAGNDTLAGDLGSDTYVFGQGSGHDQIYNYEPEFNQSPDRVLLKPEVTAVDVELKIVQQDSYGNSIPDSLQLRLKSTGETLLVRDQFGTWDGSPTTSAIDTIEFADGTVWDRAEIDRRTHLIEGTAGDEWILGTLGDDVIDGGAGNDHLLGNEGSDTYLFGYGSGQDHIYNNEPDLNHQSIDRILLKPEVHPDDVSLSVVTADLEGNIMLPASLMLRLRSTGDALVVYQQFESSTGGPLTAAIDFIEFADGTVWDRTEIERRARLVEGTSGDDWLSGTTGDDVIDGRAGNDHMSGDLGSDTYIFGQGYGNDEIYNFEPEASQSIDRIRLNPDVNPADVELHVTISDASGNPIDASLLLRLRSTGETLTVRGQFEPGANGVAVAAVDFIEFADGTVWDRAEIERRAHLFEGSTGDDFILGSSGNDVINGGSGNDQLQGMGGDDVLDGGEGSDMLLGDQGSDTYLFGQGSGHDYISNYKPIGDPSVDRILLKPGVSADDVELRLVTEDPAGWYMQPSLQLRLRSTGDTIVVVGHFDPNGGGNIGSIDLIEFADGTVWDRTEIERRVHLFEGTAGDDVIMAADGNDVLDGGAGKDMLAGGAGSDTYVFGQGYGHDLIHNQEPEGMTSSDRILLKPEVNAADVELRVVTVDTSGNSIPPSLQLRLKSTGETVTVWGHFDTTLAGENAITTIEFADGTVWSDSQIRARANYIPGTSGNDVLYGGAGNDYIDGGAGRDTMQGGLGDDVYIVERSTDSILESSNAGDDTVQSSVTYTLTSNVENLVLTGGGAINGTGNSLSNVLTGNAAVNVLSGGGGHDTLNGGAGNDTLSGGTGNDTYWLARGSGRDTVQESDSTSGNNDVAQFALGIGADQLWFRRTSNHLEVSVIGSSDALVIKDWYLGSRYRVEEFKTADGQVLLDNQVQNLVQAMASFAPPAAGQTTLPESYATALSPVIAANWQ